MRTIAGAIILLAAAICFAAGLLAEAYGDRPTFGFFTLGVMATAVFFVLGVATLMIGLIKKGE